MKRTLPSLAVLAALFLCGTARSEVLPDSTTAGSFTLANGLEVHTRHVPGAPGVAIALAYRVGTDSDPAAQPGLAELMAEVAFTAPAGAIPERHRGEMESLRPLGWVLRVNPAWTLFLESAGVPQFPGVLRQVATRMREPRVSQASLATARATIQRELGERWIGDPARSLYERVRAHAAGAGEAWVVEAASGRALASVKPAEAETWLARWYVPANAVLVLAGDLSALDPRKLVESEFGNIPGGSRATVAAAALDSAGVRVARRELTGPLAAVGVLAPALTDTLHPSFLLAMMVYGQAAKNRWTPHNAPGGSRFHFSVLDDPRIARFYPPVAAPDDSPADAATTLALLVENLMRFTIINRDFYESLRAGFDWFLGGPIPAPLRSTMRRDPAALNQLAASIAGRAMWGDEAFWAEYRRRLDPTVSPAAETWHTWIVDPARQSRVVMVPAR